MANRSAIKAGHAYILIEAMDKSGTVLNNIAKRLDGLSQRFLFVGRQAMLLGTAMSIPMGSAVNAAREFSDEVLFLQSVLGATDADIAPLVKRIKELGATTSYTAAEVAQAATSLAQGGFNQAKILDSLQAVLDMARGARMELGTTADILVDTLTLFSMPASKASEVADKFFIAAKNGTITVADLAQSFSYTGQSAAEMGYDLDQTLSILSSMSLRMLKATKAGTSLNQFITSLATRSEDIEKLLHITPFDAKGQAKNGLVILRDIAEVSKTLSQRERLSIFEKIFNVRGERAALAIANGLDLVFDSVTEMKDSFGAARKAREKMDSGIGGSIRRMASGFNLLKIEVGLALEETFENLEKSLLPFLAGLGKFVQKNPELVREVAKTIVALFAYGTAIISIGIALRLAAGSVRIFAAVLRVTLLPFRLLILLSRQLHRALGLVAKAGMYVVSTLLSLVVGTGKLLLSFARLVISITTALVPALITASAKLLYFVAVTIPIAILQIMNLSLTITESLGKAIVDVGWMIMSLSVKLSLTAMNIIAITGNIIALAGELLVFLGPVIAVIAAVVALAAGFVALYTAISYIGVLKQTFIDLINSTVNLSLSLAYLFETFGKFSFQIISRSFTHIWTFLRTGFFDTITSVVAMWDDMVFAFGMSFEKIKALIVAGDLEGAFKVILITLKFLWDSAILEMEILWSRFATGGKIAFINMVTEITLAWMRYKQDFIADIDDIVSELQFMATTVYETFRYVFDLIFGVAKALSPKMAAIAETIGEVMKQASTDAGILFTETIRAHQLDRDLKRVDTNRLKSDEEKQTETDIETSKQQLRDEQADLMAELETVKELKRQKEELLAMPASGWRDRGLTERSAELERAVTRAEDIKGKISGALFELRRLEEKRGELAATRGLGEEGKAVLEDAKAKIDALKHTMGRDIEDLAAEKDKLRAEFEKTLAGILPPTEVVGEAKMEEEVKNLLSKMKMELPGMEHFDVPEAVKEKEKDMKHFSTALPAALQKGTIEAAQQAYENQQVALMSSMDYHLKEIERLLALELDKHIKTPSARIFGEAREALGHLGMSPAAMIFGVGPVS